MPQIVKRLSKYWDAWALFACFVTYEGTAFSSLLKHIIFNLNWLWRGRSPSHGLQRFWFLPRRREG